MKQESKKYPDWNNKYRRELLDSIDGRARELGIPFENPTLRRFLDDIGVYRTPLKIGNYQDDDEIESLGIVNSPDGRMILSIVKEEYNDLVTQEALLDPDIHYSFAKFEEKGDSSRLSLVYTTNPELKSSLAKEPEKTGCGLEILRVGEDNEISSLRAEISSLRADGFLMRAYSII